MKSGCFFAAALLLGCGQSLAGEQPAAVTPVTAKENSENNEAPLADPTKAAKAPKRGEQPAADDGASERLEDPTRMNENFRAALQHSGRTKAAPESGAAAPAPVLPDIKLVASVCGRRNPGAAAMLRIDDKTEIVHAGDKLTRIEKNQLIEIHVLEIHRRFVKLMVFPSNEILILR